MKKTSLTFRLFKKLRIIANEEKYGDISPLGIARHAAGTILRLLAYKYCYSGILLESVNCKWLRAWLWRKMGVAVGRNVHIYHRVALDYGNVERIFLEDDVSITNGCTLLCHRRDLSNYRKGDSILAQPYVYGDIRLKKGCFIGMNTMVLPGVTVGEGAFVCACSVVSKDVPAWTVAAGSPARVVSRIPARERDGNNIEAEKGANG